MSDLPSLPPLPRLPGLGPGNSLAGNLADALFNGPPGLGDGGRGPHGDHGHSRTDRGNGHGHGNGSDRGVGNDGGPRGPGNGPPGLNGNGNGPPLLSTTSSLVSTVLGTPAALVRTLLDGLPGFNPPNSGGDRGLTPDVGNGKTDANATFQRTDAGHQTTAPASPPGVNNGQGVGPGSGAGPAGPPPGSSTPATQSAPGVPNFSGIPTANAPAHAGVQPPIGNSGQPPGVLSTVLGGVEQTLGGLLGALGLGANPGASTSGTSTSTNTPVSPSLGTIVPSVVTTAGNVLGSLGSAASSTVAATLAQQALAQQAQAGAQQGLVPTGYTALATAVPGQAAASLASLPGNAASQSSLLAGAQIANQAANAPAATASNLAAPPGLAQAPVASAATTVTPTQLPLAQPGTSTLAAATQLPAGIPLQSALPAQVPPQLAAADRLSQLPQMSAPPASTMAAASTVAGNAAATAPGNAALIAAPLAQQPIVAADPRAALPLAANDRAQMQRSDGTALPAGHTGESQQKRKGRDGQGGDPSRFASLLMALSAAGNPAARSQAEARERAERIVERALQWTFWVLAIVAYGSLAFTVVALMGANSQGEDLALRMQQDNTGWIAIAGLVTGIAAWWVGRKLPAR